MNERMKILKEVAVKADLFRKETEKLGEIAQKAFTEQDKTGKHKSQLKGLETIANSALKASDVLDFIKRQTGRAKPDEGWKQASFKLTKQSFDNLKNKNIPDNLLERLKTLENQEVVGERNFLNAVEKQFGKEQTERYKELILRHAQKQQFGKQLLEKIGTDLKNSRNAICTQLNISDEAQKLEVYLLLIREFIRQVVIHYEYQIGAAQ